MPNYINQNSTSRWLAIAIVGALFLMPVFSTVSAVMMAYQIHFAEKNCERDR